MSDTNDRNRGIAWIREGSPVFDDNLLIGTVSGFVSRTGGSPSEFLVQAPDTDHETIFRLADLDLDRSTSDTLLLLATGNPESATDTVVMPLAEEELTIRVRERDRGVVRIRKRVEVTPVHETIELRRDEVLVEQRQVDEPAESIRAPWQDGDTLVVPVYEEIVVTEKRLMLREELRITRRSVSESVEVNESVQHHRIDFEKIEPSDTSG